MPCRRGNTKETRHNLAESFPFSLSSFVAEKKGKIVKMCVSVSGRYRLSTWYLCQFEWQSIGERRFRRKFYLSKKIAIGILLLELRRFTYAHVQPSSSNYSNRSFDFPYQTSRIHRDSVRWQIEYKFIRTQIIFMFVVNEIIPQTVCLHTFSTVEFSCANHSEYREMSEWGTSRDKWHRLIVCLACVVGGIAVSVIFECEFCCSWVQ